MSWDESVESKDIKGIGIARIITREDDWNRSERSVSINSDSHHIESRYINHHLESSKNYYAVPNGMTINHSLDLPEVVVKSFQEYLCHNYDKESLKEYVRLLKNNRAKFEYPMNRKNKLGSVATAYFKHYKKTDRSDCCGKVIEALNQYDEYQYNFTVFTDIKKDAEKKKHELDFQVLELSTEIY